MRKQLEKLQKNIAIHQKEVLEEEQYWLTYSSVLYFYEIEGLYNIHCYSEGYDEFEDIDALEDEPTESYAFCKLLELLTKQENADQVVALKFSAPDAGANGLKVWDFGRLTRSVVTFPNLKSFEVAVTEAGDHNTASIGAYDDEDGAMVTQLVAKMPKINYLVLPAVPDAGFFKLDLPNLNSLKVQVPSMHQNFIVNLAKSKNLLALRSLDFSEPLHDWGDEGNYTPFEDYKALFSSLLFAQNEAGPRQVGLHFKLRHSPLTKEQLIELQRINTTVQFLVLPAQPSYYVSHCMKE